MITEKQGLVLAISQMVQSSMRDKGLAIVPVSANSVLLDSGIGIDSLDLAAIVVQLTEKTGRDPFANGFIEFQTVGELASLYAQPQ